MASYLALCNRCSARVRFMTPPDIGAVICDTCKGDIAANEEGAGKMAETLKQRIERKGGATKAGQQVGEANPLVKGTPLEKRNG